MKPFKMKRCSWVNLNNPLCIKYHDEEWGIPSHDDNYLFEILVLESFQAGLSWSCILNKREDIRKAFDNFNYKKIANYNEHKIEELLSNDKIIRNKLKIKAIIKNAQIYQDIQKEYQTFSNYIWHFTNNKIISNNSNIIPTKNDLSIKISKDLENKGMKYVGPTIIYSFLEAIGIINDHEKECYKYNKIS